MKTASATGLKFGDVNAIGEAKQEEDVNNDTVTEPANLNEVSFLGEIAE